MDSLNKEAILKTIASIETSAEYEPNRLEDFLMMKEYSYMRDPKRFLVLGGRGSGKTRLFYTFTEPAGFSEILKGESLSGLGSSTAYSIKGHDFASFFPTPDILENYAEDKSARAYWVGNLLFVLFNQLKKIEKFRPIVDSLNSEKNLQLFFNIENLKMIDHWLEYIKCNPEIWERVFQQINDYLRGTNEWIFVSYDFLDRLTVDYNSLFPFIRMLLSFWFAHDRHWDRIRSKVFLRNDLFESDLLNFMDASKLNNHLIRLEWRTLSLYRLLIKRLANSHDEDTLQYLQIVPNLISSTKKSVLGYIPTLNKDTVESLIDNLIGHYMGKSPKQGVSYQWMPNHLQDAKGALSPRSFLKCFSIAANGMLEHPAELGKLSPISIILPTMIQNALVSVSEDRVAELGEEYPWLAKLKDMLDGLTMLVTKDAFLERIDINQWTDEEKKQLPSQSAQGIFQVLVKLGIIFVAEDGRINTPEIYLHGFRMKRKGGLRRIVDD
ncbi:MULTISPECIES: hypothetical protein [unclassified Desulfovibrio]|uniref:P-loop ATPase, Sll1717 family n=1 Tax=unclassified Desulfovibrio TaxID=2593640 RepID=UPI0013EB70DD|nr:MULTISPECIES: hypothetical protein [unclassified Desulfovibrio]